jgi:hypothetical protein
MKRKKYNENYFEKIDSEDKAYFLGLICADGCILNNKKTYRYQVALKLHIKDIEILKTFIKCIICSIIIRFKFLNTHSNIWKI